MRRFFRKANNTEPTDSPPEIEIPPVPATPPPSEDEESPSVPTAVSKTGNGQVITDGADLVEIPLPDDAPAVPTPTLCRRGVFGRFADWIRRVFGSKRSRGNVLSGQDLEKAQRELDTIPEESETDEEPKTTLTPPKLVRYDIPVVVVHDPNI